MSWYLRKEWVDQDERLDAVLLHYTWGPVGYGPDWGSLHEWRPLMASGGHRFKVVSMPTSVWDDRHGGWNPFYAFHYYFEVFAGGGRWTTETFTDDIVSVELEFVDEPGLITNLCIYYAVNDWGAPSYSPMEDYRFPQDSEFTSLRYYGYQDKPRYHHAKYHMLQEIPTPHYWKGRMWGPRGARLVQQYHIGRMYPENEQGEFFYGPDGADHPAGSHWVHELS